MFDKPSCGLDEIDLQVDFGLIMKLDCNDSNLAISSYARDNVPI